MGALPRRHWAPEDLLLPGLVLLVVLVGAVGAWNVAVVSAGQEHEAVAAERALLKALAIDRVDTASERAARLARAYLLSPEPALLDALARARGELQAGLRELQALGAGTAVEPRAARALGLSTGTFAGADRLLALRRAGGHAPDAVAAWGRQLDRERSLLEAELAGLGEGLRAELRETQATSTRRLHGTLWRFAATLALLLAALALCTALLARSLWARARAQRGAQERAADLAAVLESIPEAAFVADAHAVQFANRPALALLGDEGLGPVARGGLPALAARLQLRRPGEAAPTPVEDTCLLRALREERVLEDVVAQVGGREHMLHAAVAPVRLGGRVAGVVAILGDVTEARERERQLALSEARFAGIVTIAADAILTLDGARRITLFNRGAEEAFGYAAAEVLGRPVELLMPARLRAAQAEAMQALAAGARAAGRLGERAEVVGLRKGGEEFPAEAAISRLEVDGEPLVTVVLRDVSERQRALREQRFLAEAGAALAESLDSEVTLARLAGLAVPELADCCLLVLAEGHHAHVAASAHCAPEVGAELDEVLREARLPLDAPDGVAEVIRGGRTRGVEGIPQDLRRAAAASGADVGRLGPCQGLVVPLRARGRSLGALVLLRRPPRAAPDARARALAEELAQRAALALDNVRLFADAQRATRARDEVLGVVAHDLRNPLNTITLLAGVLQRKLPEAGARAAQLLPQVERLLDGTRRMDRLIQDLLDVVRMEAGTLAVAPAPVDARRLVLGAADALRPLVEAARLRLQLRLEEDAGEVSADADRILQVLGNLLGNALKFTPAGGTLTVGLATRGAEALFWVADTGPGIPADALPHLFERYWQARPEERRGAGLGLSISKGLVEAHGGRIWAESTPGRGSVFFFTLPRLQPEAHAPH